MSMERSKVLGIEDNVEHSLLLDYESIKPTGYTVHNGEEAWQVTVRAGRENGPDRNIPATLTLADGRVLVDAETLSTFAEQTTVDAEPAAKSGTGSGPAAATTTTVDQTTLQFYQDSERWILGQRPVLYNASDTSRRLTGLAWTGSADRQPVTADSWTVAVTLNNNGQELPGGPHRLTIRRESNGYSVFLAADTFDLVARHLATTAPATTGPATPARTDALRPLNDRMIRALRETHERDPLVYRKGETQPVAELTVDWEDFERGMSGWQQEQGVGWVGSLRIRLGGDDSADRQVNEVVLHALATERPWLELPSGE